MTATLVLKTLWSNVRCSYSVRYQQVSSEERLEIERIADTAGFARDDDIWTPSSSRDMIELRRLLSEASYVVRYDVSKDGAYNLQYLIAETVLADGSSGIDAVNDIYEKLDATAVFATSHPERLRSGKRPEPAFLMAKPYENELVVEMLSQARRHNRELAEHRERIFGSESQG